MRLTQIKKMNQLAQVRGLSDQASGKQVASGLTGKQKQKRPEGRSGGTLHAIRSAALVIG